jgi:hypothetical protein
VPTIPTPKRQSAAPKDGIDSLEREVRERVGSKPPRGRPKTRASDSPPSDPIPRGGKRTPSTRKLEEQISRFYMIVGTVLTPFSRWYPPLKPISENLKVFSTEAAEAWVDLAEEDAKIKKYWESLTSASAWGNVIGIHFAIIASSMPIGRMVQGQPTQDDPLDFARKMGLSEDEIKMAMQMAGVGGDTVRTGGEPVPDINTIRNKEKKSGIVTPDDLGVTNDGAEWSDPMRSGGIT